MIATLSIVFMIPPSPRIEISSKSRDLAIGRYIGFHLTPPSNEALLKLGCIDIAGTLFFFGFILALVMALQWGGAIYPWSNPRVITLVIVAALLLAFFVAWEIYTQKSAPVLDVAYFKNRSIVGACVIAFSCSFLLISGVCPSAPYSTAMLITR